MRLWELTGAVVAVPFASRFLSSTAVVPPRSCCTQMRAPLSVHSRTLAPPPPPVAHPSLYLFICAPLICLHESTRESFIHTVVPCLHGPGWLLCNWHKRQETPDALCCHKATALGCLHKCGIGWETLPSRSILRLSVQRRQHSARCSSVLRGPEHAQHSQQPSKKMDGASSRHEPKERAACMLFLHRSYSPSTLA